MKKLFFTAAILFSMHLGFSETPKTDAPKAEAPKTEVSKENDHYCYCVTVNICGNLCVVCGCTEQEIRDDIRAWADIYCVPKE